MSSDSVPVVVNCGAGAERPHGLDWIIPGLGDLQLASRDQTVELADDVAGFLAL